ncbi:Uncharacterised protein [uncultured archaeon]|nr:Uncharacterised protein [uncultured archaeon]
MKDLPYRYVKNDEDDCAYYELSFGGKIRRIGKFGMGLVMLGFGVVGAIGITAAITEGDNHVKTMPNYHLTHETNTFSHIQNCSLEKPKLEDKL